MFNVNKGNTQGEVRTGRKKGKKGKDKIRKIDKGLKIYKAPRPPKSST